MGPGETNGTREVGLTRFNPKKSIYTKRTWKPGNIHGNGRANAQMHTRTAADPPSSSRGQHGAKECSFGVWRPKGDGAFCCPGLFVLGLRRDADDDTNSVGCEGEERVRGSASMSLDGREAASKGAELRVDIH